MQFRDLQKQYEVLKPQIDEAMTNVAASARFVRKLYGGGYRSIANNPLFLFSVKGRNIA